MAESDYMHGSMEISEQTRTWSGFITATLWGSFIIVLLVSYSTLTVAMGMHWMIALGLCAAMGLAGGAFLGMGGAWVATVLGLGALAVVIQVIITLFSLIG